MAKFKAMTAEERRAYDQYAAAAVQVLLGKFAWSDIASSMGHIAVAAGRVAGELVKQRRFEVRAKKE